MLLLFKALLDQTKGKDKDIVAVYYHWENHCQKVRINSHSLGSDEEWWRRELFPMVLKVIANGIGKILANSVGIYCQWFRKSFSNGVGTYN
jgi:hypothetical protein